MRGPRPDAVFLARIGAAKGAPTEKKSAPGVRGVSMAGGRRGNPHYCFEDLENHSYDK